MFFVMPLADERGVFSLISFIMDPFIIGAGITALSSLANSVIGSKSGANLNKTNRRWQENMADLQYQRQRDLTQDTALLQKQGLVNAGMSPSAMGAFAGPASSVSSVPSSPSSLPEYTPLDINSIINAYTAAKQGEVADSEVRKNDTQADKNAKEAGRYDELTDATIDKIRSEVGVNEADVARINAQVPLLQNQSAYYNYLAENEEVRWQTAQATKQSEIDRIVSENKFSKAEAEKKLDMIDDIINAQYELTLAQIYNARASGQAALSNAYTSRLQYQLDKSLNTYLQTYYKESAEKLKQEATSEDTLRAARLKLLDNDGDFTHARKVYQDNLNSTYTTDNAVDNASKVIGAVTGAVNAGTNARNAQSRELDAYTRAGGTRKDVHVYHHKR